MKELSAVDHMRCVIVESPFAGDVAAVERNMKYARAAMRDCLLRGESPYASHLLYTQPGVLDDNVPEERQQGIDAGLAWAKVADAVVIYHDLGISRGMSYSIEAHQKAGRNIIYRTLVDWS